MKTFKRGGKSGGRGFAGRDSGGRGFGGGRGMGMNKAICSDCKKECEIPFKPTGNRPVYCSDCFRNHDEGSQERFGGGNKFKKAGFGDRKGRSYQDKQMFSAICDECKERCEVPFSPTKGKPIYCNQCFGKGSDVTRGGNNNRSNEDLKMISEKLDNILRIMNSLVLSRDTKEKVEKEEKIVSTEKKQKKEKTTAKAKKTTKAKTKK